MIFKIILMTSPASYEKSFALCSVSFNSFSILLFSFYINIFPSRVNLILFLIHVIASNIIVAFATHADLYFHSFDHVVPSTLTSLSEETTQQYAPMCEPLTDTSTYAYTSFSCIYCSNSLGKCSIPFSTRKLTIFTSCL